MKKIWILIKAFFAVKKGFKVVKKTKAGVKTSEFWMVVLSQIVPVVLSIWGLIPPDVLITILAFAGTLAGIYLVARTWIKSTETKKDDMLHNEIIKLIKPLADKLNIKLEIIPIDEE